MIAENCEENVMRRCERCGDYLALGNTESCPFQPLFTRPCIIWESILEIAMSQRPPFGRRPRSNRKRRPDLRRSDQVGKCPEPPVPCSGGDPNDHADSKLSPVGDHPSNASPLFPDQHVNQHIRRDHTKSKQQLDCAGEPERVDQRDQIMLHEPACVTRFPGCL